MCNTNFEKNNKPEVQDIFTNYFAEYKKNNIVLPEEQKVANAIIKCRTIDMGEYVRYCNHCNQKIVLNKSCGNRHCPKCQQIAKAKWLFKMKETILPVKYFHAVFTLPHELNLLLKRNKKELYNLLFLSVWQIFQNACKNPLFKMVGMPGYTAILHTWTKKLNYHVHLHCIIPSVVLTNDLQIKSRDDFFLPIDPLETMFKQTYLAGLKKLFLNGNILIPESLKFLKNKRSFFRYLKPLYVKNWIVYLKEPFNGAENAFNYLGRYTHRVAISNNRIKSIKNNTVTFDFKDSKDNYKIKRCPIDVYDFIGLFLQHVLPSRFFRIRHFGFLANKRKKTLLAIIKSLLCLVNTTNSVIPSTSELVKSFFGIDIDICPFCKKGKLLSFKNYKIFLLSQIYNVIFYDSS